MTNATYENRAPVRVSATGKPRGFFAGIIEEDLKELALVDAFTECLEAVERGATMKAAAARHPEARDEIRSLLEIAVLLRQRKHFALGALSA